MLKRPLRRFAAALAAALALAACALDRAGSPSASAVAASLAPTLEQALTAGDLAGVQRIASQRGRPRGETALAAAALAGWLHQDDEAGAALTHAMQDRALPESLRRQAARLLADVRYRQSRYAEVVAALDIALPGVTDAEQRKDMEQTRAFAAALTGAAPMQANVPGPGSIALSRDLAGLTRGPVTINDGVLDAIIDTGSAVSTISESNARRLGLHLLEGQVSVGTATAASATAKLAIADRLTFGGAQFRNVVFLVMPDEALTFANGAYVVHAIIGLPVLLELGRVSYSTVAGAETLSYRRTGARPDGASNLMLEGAVPFTFARVDGAGAPLRLFIDNGANSGHLNQRFAADFPALMTSAVRQTVTRTGGAGSETQDAMQLPHLVLTFGAISAPISDVDVIDDHNNDRHGTLGLDALRTAPGYILDFEAMRFELLPQP